MGMNDKGSGIPNFQSWIKRTGKRKLIKNGNKLRKI